MPMDASLLVTTDQHEGLQGSRHQAGTRRPSPSTAADLKTIAAKGIVKNPLDIPFAAAEGLSTYWYEMTAAFGGQVLSATVQAASSRLRPRRAIRRWTWMVNAYKSGLVPKANLDEQDYQAFETDQAHNLHRERLLRLRG